MINTEGREEPDTDVNSCTSNIEEQKVQAKDSSKSLHDNDI